MFACVCVNVYIESMIVLVREKHMSGKSQAVSSE